MKLIVPALAVMFCITACEPITPSYKKHQPDDPKTWSPAGHKYVSEDSSRYGRYLGFYIEFLTEDTYRRLWFYELNGRYRVDYPYIFLGDNIEPYYTFLDTLTITKTAEGADDSKCYKLNY